MHLLSFIYSDIINLNTNASRSYGLINIHSEVQTCQIKYQNLTETLSVHECLSLGSSVIGTASNYES